MSATPAEENADPVLSSSSIIGTDLPCQRNKEIDDDSNKVLEDRTAFRPETFESLAITQDANSDEEALFDERSGPAPFKNMARRTIARMWEVVAPSVVTGADAANAQINNEGSVDKNADNPVMDEKPSS
mmetsp:Transcript_21643/g.47286  ORF Transcript_21643/g.47286 Transcript_21643/m.47286 type:complete len:129 (+) Transcript_21643:1-387(+)